MDEVWLVQDQGGDGPVLSAHPTKQAAEWWVFDVLDGNEPAAIYSVKYIEARAKGVPYVN